MPRTRPPRQVRWATVVLAAASGLTIAACGSGAPNPVGSAAPSSPAATPTSSPTARTASTGPLAPLTNLPSASAADAGRPAVAVVVSGSDPAGLGSADVVYQDFTSPAVRYVAVFQSRESSAVGPVTGTRPEDGQILSVLHPVTGYDGGTTTFVSILDKSGIKDASYAAHSSAYVASAAGVNGSTEDLLHAVSGGTAPPPLFRYRGSETGATTLATSGLSRPTSVRITIPGYGTQDWSFDAKANRWVQVSGGPKVEVANLVIQTVPYKGVYESHKLGIIVPSARVLGSGHAQVFSGSAPGGGGGTAATGTWSKPHSAEVTNYFDASGSPMALQPGPTWVILAPSGTQASASG